jgi:putative thioredoxin
VSQQTPAPSNLPAGAVDLAALAAQREAQERAANAPAGLIKDVTTANFESDVIQQSMTVPVVLDLWAEWCEPCKTLSPILEGLAAEDGGKWILAKVDVDAEQQIAQAFQVQSIPSVFAVIKGQPMPLFQGALPKEQIRQYLDALLAESAKNGVSGVVGSDAETPASADEAPQEPAAVPMDPDLSAAYDAMEAADWDAAEAAFGRLLKKTPDDVQAKIGSATAALYRRVDGLDPTEVLDAADKDVTDAALQCSAADFQAVNGDFEAGFSRLIAYISTTSGDDRVTARTRLLELFEVAGPDHPALPNARVALANALF